MSVSYPSNDSEYREVAIAKVEESRSGWAIADDEGWALFISRPSPVEPQAGMSARFYGRGIGSPVRGLFLDGRKVFYRTPEEHLAHSNREMYGESAEEWLRRWDEGRSVWSISMGGFGPGYEQALQIAAAEIVRWMISQELESDWEKRWEEISKAIDSEALPKLDKLGLSGAQWGAAKCLASSLVKLGPIKLFTDERYEDRKIQVRKNFPSL